MNAPAALKRFELVHWSKLKAALPAREPLVTGLLDRFVTAMVYGRSGAGKSFWVLDLCLCIARGVQWRGQAVRKGAVAYIVAEGAVGFRERVEAYRQAHSLTENDDVPFFVINSALDLHGDTDIGPLIAQVLASGPFELIAVDTLACTIGAGNENAAHDMARYLSNVGKLKAATQATVLIVHHTGKDEAKGARGHSSLSAAIETGIEISAKGNHRVAKPDKQRDKPDQGAFPFTLEQVTLPAVDGGEPLTSCVVVQEVTESVSNSPASNLTPGEIIALQALQAHGEAMGEPEWRQAFYAKASGGERAKQKRFKRAKDGLLDRGNVIHDNGTYCLPSAGCEHGEHP